MSKKKIDMNSKSAKYFVARKEGKTKTQAIKVAGITDIRNVGHIERTDTYKELERRYADHLQDEITMQEVAVEQAKVIRQDSDRGAKNTAIKQFLEKVEPDTKQGTDEEKMIVVLRA